jgi:LacI family transcriptional regulator, fructose operon transcriptional repressor
MVNIKDVAEAAGVSTATVSRVLADKPHVRTEVRDHVLEVIEELKFRPNRVARSLRAQKTNIIGLIVSDIQNPFFTLISRAVEDAAYGQGLSIFLCNADEDPEKEALYVKLMREERVSGVILSPTQKTSNNFTEIANFHLPIVVIDRCVQDVELDTVLIDNVKSAHKIISHLIGHGYKRIGAIFGSGSTTGEERYEGYLKALGDHGRTPSKELCFFVNAREEEGYRAAKELLKLSSPPDAVFAGNGLLSAGALRALRESALKIPQEIAFASFDETPWSTLVDPPITVIEQPTYDIGRTAVELLVKRIQDPTCSTRKITLNGKLIIRKSCGC